MRKKRITTLFFTAAMACYILLPSKRATTLYIKGSACEDQVLPDGNHIFNFSDSVLTRYIYEE